MKRLKPSGTPVGAVGAGHNAAAAHQIVLRIDKDVPMPGPRQRASVLRDTLLEMAVGDSVVVKRKGPLFVHAKRIHMKLVSRQEGDSFRVWRFA